MSDEPNVQKGRDAVVRALLNAEKSNAGNDRQELIEAALTKMIGRSIRSPRGLMQLGRGASLLPDFSDLPKHESYRELTTKISTIEKVTGATEAALYALLELGEDGALWDIDRFSSIDRSERLSLLNAAVLHGLSMSCLTLLVEVHKNARRAADSLEAERRAFYPGGKGRKRNPRPYLVAEKLARFYLAELKERPTYGTDYGVPSTRYQSALEDIFKILGIRAGTRLPAKAACNGITEEDLKRARGQYNALAEMVRDFGR